MTGERVRGWLARLSVVLAIVLVSVALTKLWSFAHTDDPDVLEQSVITRTAAAACARMRDTASEAAVGTTAPISQRVGAINAQNDAVTELVATMEQLGAERLASDRPVERWLADWQRLVAARDGYAQSLAAGRPRPMHLPVVDGRPLVERLNTVGVSCRVPFALLAP
ncbi:hypothetical protein [Pedococcus sp. 5OH_020]|uniref:hypothetical protein n=1 Tax=Pedococcus sp. 5OH_020 TaxID=2989814 RepID=UPI0022E9D893|nr:hypothetical protein [Pedococcus sp. 5OH_020]